MTEGTLPEQAATLRLPGLAATGARPSSVWADGLRRLARNRAAMAGLLFIVCATAGALFAPLLAPYGYAEQDMQNTWTPPGPGHLLGTDALGRDMLSRLLYGARVSLSVALVAQAIILAVGVPIGLVAGYFRRADAALMRVVDALYAFPSLLFIIAFMTFFKGIIGTTREGPLLALASLNSLTGGLIGVFIALGLTHWLTVSRLVRAQVLSLKQREFVEAAASLGSSHRRIILVHLLPNSLAPVIVAATLGIPQAIMIEAGLSFVGLGVDPPMPSWGTMISEGLRAMRSFPHLVVPPAAAIALIMLSFNFLGDGLRDAMDPLMK